MKISDMRFMDDKFGPLVCFVFYWYNAAKKVFIKPNLKINPAKINSILIIKFFGMGSIMLATPMMRALKNHFPNAKITILTFYGNKNLCQKIDIIDEVVAIDTSSLLRFVNNICKTLSYVRKRHFDISIDLEFFAKSSTLIQYLCATRIRVGYYLVQYGILLKMMWRGDLLTHNVYYNSHRHAIEAFLALAKSIGADTENMDLVKIRISDQDRFNLRNLLSNMGVKEGDKFIVLNINANQLCLERRWPIDNFVELTKKMLNQGNIKIFLIGDSLDIEYVDKFMQMIEDKKRMINLTDKLDIGMLAALFENTKLLVTNDSGPLHLAVSLGVPTISLFGPETPERFGYLGKKHAVFYARIYCSPCVNVYNQKVAPCNGNNECMRKILIEDVYEAVKKCCL